MDQSMDYKPFENTKNESITSQLCAEKLYKDDW